MQQGDVWLLELADQKPRPCLVITRNEALSVRNHVTVVPITRTVRGIPTEVAFGAADGVRFDSVASFDSVGTVARASLTRRLGRLADGRWHEVCIAIRNAIAC